MKQPYVGATVHYLDRPRSNSEPSAAIITKVHNDDNAWVSLFIISPGGGTRFVSHVERGIGWDWIVEPKEPESLDRWNGI